MLSGYNGSPNTRFTRGTTRLMSWPDGDSSCGHSSQDTSHLILHCSATDSAPLAFWRLSVSLRSLVHTLGSCPASGTPWSSAMPPIPRKGSGNIHQQQQQGPSYPGHSLRTNHFFAALSMNDRRREAPSEIGRLISLFSCLSLTRLFILLVQMSGNVHLNPSSIFPCSVCAGNMTWRGRSVQCCTCSKWVHLRCSLLSFS